MTPRERQTSGAYSTTIADLPQTHSSGMLSETGVGETHWEVLYSCLSSLEHRKLVDLARQQGLLYAVPLPRKTQHQLVHPDANESSRPHHVTRLLQGDVKNLSAFDIFPLASFRDEQLTPVQQHAVTAGLSTPDICVLQSADASESTRVIAEIITQAAERGQRVLFLSRTPQMLDRALEKLAGREPLYVLRCLDRDETVEQLAPPIRGLTFSERSRILRERAFDCAHQASAESKRRLQCHSREEETWRQLAALAERHDKFAKKLQHAASLCGEQQRYQQQLDEIAAQLKGLRPLAQAKQNGRWWLPAWWRATFQKGKISRCTELETQEKTLQDTLVQLEERLTALELSETCCQSDEQNFASCKQQTLSANGMNHGTNATGQLERQLSAVQQEGHSLAATLEMETIRPTSFSLEAIETCRQKWQAHCAQEKEKARFLEQWLKYLEEFGDELAQRLPRLANAVAATFSALPEEENFGHHCPEQTFDLLIVAEAEQISDEELQQVSSRALRCVLVGDPSPRTSEVAKTSEVCSRQKSQSPQDSCFHRLGKLLHCDPSTSQYRWEYERDGLCCRLRNISAEQRDYLEVESVADQPEIELRILNRPHVEPILAEVVFPASTSPAQAKEFIYRELEEVALQTLGRNLLWQQDEQRLLLHLAHTGNADADALILEEGIREHFLCDNTVDGNPGSCLTIALEFDRTRGWDLQRARDWLQRRLGWTDLGRCFLLSTRREQECNVAGAVTEPRTK